MDVGFLHPGQMGASIAAACHANTHWVGAGRSPATRSRAEAAGLTDAGSLATLVRQCDAIVSVCPPGEAEAVAASVADAGFSGLYADVNAIAPSTARRIAERFDHFVDGGIVGPPAARDGTTRLYLSGDEAESVAALWAGSPLAAIVIGDEPGKASALKAAYAGWTKTTGALLLAVRALARAEGVEASLLDEWARSQPDLVERSERAAAANGPKGWRFGGELREIGLAFADCGLPAGFGDAAAEIFDRFGSLRDANVDLEAVLATLR